MPRSLRIPYPYIKDGQLVVCLRDPVSGYRRNVYLGPDTSPASRMECARVRAEWEQADRVVRRHAPASTPRRR